MNIREAKVMARRHAVIPRYSQCPCLKEIQRFHKRLITVLCEYPNYRVC